MDSLTAATDIEGLDKVLPLLEEARHEEALPLIEDNLAKQPDVVIWKYLKALVIACQARGPEAVSLLEECSRLDGFEEGFGLPDDVNTLARASALNHLQFETTVDPTLTEPWENLARVAEILNSPDFIDRSVLGRWKANPEDYDVYKKFEAHFQEKDLDERMHTTPWFHATNIKNAPATNLVQIGIGGWQSPREGVKVGRERQSTVITVGDVERVGVEKIAEIALETAWKDAKAVYLSFDIDVIDAGFVPGTGWPEPGGLLPREALNLVKMVSEPGLAGIEVVECSPPYDWAEQTALMSSRVILDSLAAQVRTGKLGNKAAARNRPAWGP